MKKMNKCCFDCHFIAQFFRIDSRQGIYLKLIVCQKTTVQLLAKIKRVEDKLSL